MQNGSVKELINTLLHAYYISYHSIEALHSLYPSKNQKWLGCTLNLS